MLLFNLPAVPYTDSVIFIRRISDTQSVIKLQFYEYVDVLIFWKISMKFTKMFLIEMLLQKFMNGKCV